MDKLINFTDMLESRLYYGGNAGFKRGIFYNDSQWLIKFPQDTSNFVKVDISFTTSPLSEYIGSHIFEILGYNVHQTILGIYNNKKIKRIQLVVACKDFTNNGNLKLIDYESIRNNYSDDLQIQLTHLRAKLPEYKSNGISSHTIPIEEVMLQFEENKIFKNCKGIKNLFWEILLIDCLINNNDRNKNNWGLLYDKNTNKYISAPIFDNGASFVSKHSDEKLIKLLNNNSSLENSALNGLCHYTVDNELLNFRNFFKKLKLNNLDSDLNKALNKIRPLLNSKFEELKQFIMKMPSEINGVQIISDIQKEYFVKTMEIRLNKLINCL